jgi:hypothetical protein
VFGKFFTPKNQNKKNTSTESNIPKAFPLNKEEPFETSLMRTAEAEKIRMREQFEELLKDDFTEEEIDRIKDSPIENIEDAAVQVITTMMMKFPIPENIETSKIPYLSPVNLSPSDAQFSIIFTFHLVLYLTEYLEDEKMITPQTVVKRAGLNILSLYPYETRIQIIKIGIESFLTILDTITKTQEGYDNYQKKMEKLKFAVWAFVKTADRGILQIISEHYIPFFNQFKNIQDKRTSS